jgi:4-amino-4-deoxy-L-arabinose transferase-like glycosyltransferase
LIAFGAIIFGLLERAMVLAAFPLRPLDTCDGRAYHSMALSLASGRGLVIADPGVVDACAAGSIAIGPSHHFAPALPIVESAFIRVLGDTPLALVLPLVLMSWLAVLVAWWTTRDLFGRDAALLVAAAVSLEWTGILYGTWFGYSENLVVTSFTLTLWALLRALRDDKYVVLAGFFAGLGYLSKASVGWFFLIAGLGGLAWRILFRGRSVFRNVWYWAAVGVFAVPVLAWAYRNVSLFWDGSPLGLIDASQTSEYASTLLANAFANPALLLIGLAGKLPITAAMLIVPFLPLLPDFRRPLRDWKDEQAFGLWLATGLMFVLGWFFASAFWVTEQTNLLWADVARYVMPAQVALLWLLVRHQRPASTSRWALSFLVLSLVLPFVVHPGSIFGA